MTRPPIFALLLLTLSAFGCEANDEDGEVAADRLLYSMPHDDGNTFACATCHALSEPSDDGLTRPGHPIGDAANRATFKDGQLTALLDAVNTCRQEWMAAPPFSADEPRWLALQAFLQEQAGADDAEPIELQIVDPPDDVSGGDEIVGEELFNSRCIVCHGESGVGTERAPRIAGTGLDGDFIARKVRRSGDPESTVYPDLLFGRMPFWQADRLSDQELVDIVAFVEMSAPLDLPPATDDEVDVSQPSGQTGCGTTHPMVGSSLTFQTHAHDVAGTATVVDDCTIRLTDFSFDGGGIDVRVIGGTGGAYDDGVTLSINLVATVFDEGQALIRLPEGVTLDDFDGLSVWCVPVGLSFGDGLFQ
jgi:cytochrome c